MADINKVYQSAYNVCLKMLKDRGYTLPAYLQPVTEDQFEVMLERKQLDMTGITDNNGIPTYVRIIEPSVPFTKDKKRVYDIMAFYFKNNGLPDITDGKKLIEAADAGKVRIIIIYKESPGSKAQNQPEKEYIQHAFIEIHEVHNLSIDPLECKYQAQWRLMTEAEVKEVKKRYDAQSIMFGGVAIDDPINRYYRGRPAEKGRPAQMYEVIRNGTSISYRRVLTKVMNIKTK